MENRERFDALIRESDSRTITEDAFKMLADELEALEKRITEVEEKQTVAGFAPLSLAPFR